MTNIKNLPKSIQRREFIKSTGFVSGSLVLGFHLPLTALDANAQTLNSGAEVDAWIVIKPDDTCVFRLARTEMGQGTRTGLAQLLAEELECDWKSVTTELVSPQANNARNKVWGQMLTVGSFGIRFSQDAMRRAGASARTMLLQACANEWKVPVSELSVANGVITHIPSGKKISYGKLAAAASKLSPPDPKSLVLKDPKDWKIVGKPLKRIDTASKLNGAQIYAVDVKLPGMLSAALIACPVFGGKLKSLNDSQAMLMPGVKKVVRVEGDAYAVIADTWWHAKKAIEKVIVEWDEGDFAHRSDATISAYLKTGLETQEGLYTFRKEGEALSVITGAVKKVEATYSAPFLAHATMEPMNCTAMVSADGAEVWVPTQDPEGAQLAISQSLGLPLEKCLVNRFDPGGGFGRRGRVSDYVIRAVQIAKQMPGVPIKMIWSREEDMTHGQYRPISQCKLTAGLDSNNRLVGMHVRLSGQSIYAWRNPTANLTGYKDDFQLQGWFAEKTDQNLCYAPPNLLIEYAMRNTHVPVGTWRGVNVPQNSFYMECFMEEVARAAKMDSVEFRKSCMKNNPRQLQILELAAQKSGWGKQLPKGVFRGVAQFMSYGTYCAAVAEVSVKPNGDVKVHRVVLALDCGYAVNPSQIEAQVQGSIVYGLSAALWGECSIQKGRVVETNFHNYRVLRLAEMPKVETYIDSKGGAWGGIGEPTIGVVAPAVINALSLAMGKPIRDLPVKSKQFA
ncbi:MAG: molybdopterin cofactor-binding domain-containing protein [Betaproteobacteria bacterium]